AGYALRRLLQNRHDAEDHSSVFVPLVRTTPVAMEMHVASATAEAAEVSADTIDPVADAAKDPADTPDGRQTTAGHP
ncbi:MAG: hypothetical protein RLN67_05300, partial [Algiphilus sp.]